MTTYKQYMEYMDTFYMRRLQTLPINNAALLCIASPIVKKLKLSTHDTMIEQVDEQGRIIITKADIRNQAEDGDGVFH